VTPRPSFRRSPAILLTLLAGLLLAGAAHAQLPDFTGLVDQVSPAVVNISATRTPSAARSGSGPTQDDLMEELLRRFGARPGMPGGPGAPPMMPRERTSMGTGFLVEADGHVLTNHHVVDGADEIYVRLRDRRELPATIVGSDPQSDIALLKIDASDLPTLRIGDSRALRPGQWVIAIGSPFGFEHSVTAGIVSATGRSSYDPTQQYVPFIQTDVAINRGNSGGPLLDIEGNVVGVNSQIFSNTGGFMGVSFAIPIEVAMNSVQQLKEQGFVSRGLLGVHIQEVNRELAQSLGLPRLGGALVTGFSEDSAAQKAGVKVGDVIMAFDGNEVVRSSDLPPLVGSMRPGTRARITVSRDGRSLDLPVTIGEVPRDEAATAARSVDPDAAAGNPLGLMVGELNAEQREALGLAAGEGVVITRIVGTPGQRAGLQPGDVVTMVARRAVGSVAQFNAAVKDAKPGQPVLLLVRRGERTEFRTVTPAAPSRGD
jgi:serine protease Do